MTTDQHPADGTGRVRPAPADDVQQWEIRVQGRLAPRWAAWFDGLDVTAQADGEEHLTAGKDGNAGDDGDPFPGSSNTTKLLDTGILTTSFPDGPPSGVRLSNIRIDAAKHPHLAAWHKRVSAIPFLKAAGF